MPEALEDRVVIAAEDRISGLLGEQHACSRERGVPDFLGPPDGQAALSGLAAAIHVAVADAPPLVSVAVLLKNRAGGIHPGGAEEAGDVQDVGTPVEPDSVVLLKFVGKVLGQYA